jgi:hypothetical protein
MALFIKEFQLHQSQYLIAGLLVLLHLGVTTIRKLRDFPVNSVPRFILENFWALWLVIPLLVGCAAVAEERKTGTFEGQLCLPVKRRTQFGVKLCVVLSLAILLGTIMPWLLEGNRILPDIHFNAAQILADVNHSGYFVTSDYFVTYTIGIIWLTLLNILASLSPFVPVFILALISAGIAALAFYASTQARSTLEALGPAVLGIILTWFLLVAAWLPGALFRFQLIHFPLWQGWLIYYIGVPVMVMGLAALGVWNFKHVGDDRHDSALPSCVGTADTAGTATRRNASRKFNQCAHLWRQHRGVPAGRPGLAEPLLVRPAKPKSSGARQNFSKLILRRWQISRRDKLDGRGGLLAGHRRTPRRRQPVGFGKTGTPNGVLETG